MTSTGRNFALGLTSLVAVLGLVYLLFQFGELESAIKRRYRLTINCKNAAGLRAGSAIELNGVPVGVVDSVETIDHRDYPVRLVVLVNEKVRIPRNVVPYATASLLGGSATLQFESHPGADGTLPSDGSGVIDGDIRSRLMEEFTAEIDRRLKPVTEAMDEFRTLARNINDLVRPPGPGGEADASNIRTAVDSLNDLLVELRETMQLTQEWLGDDRLRADIRDTAHRTARMVESATRTMDELSVTLEQIRGLATRATEGQGTIAQLLNNPDLYRSLDDAAVRLDHTLRDIQLLVEKIKAEGLPVIW